jgi:PAS domain S-box-containing protein
VRLGDLLDVSVLQRLAEANHKATGMPVGIIDAVDGSVLVGFGWQDICVMYHRANAVSAERCRESDEYIKAHLSETTPCEYTCKNGLRDIGVPIRVAGKHLATLFLGQFFYEDESPDREFFVRQARELGFDEASYLAALARVPAFTRASVENILAYNTALARVIADLAEGSLRRQQAEARVESLARFPTENPDPVLRLASDLTVEYANDAARLALKDLGVEPGMRAPAAIADAAGRARSGRQRIRAELTSGDRFYSMSVVAVGTEVNVYAQDATARKLAEEALDRERDLLSSVMHATDVMLVYLDPDFNFVWVNAAYAATCRMAPEEMVGKNHFVLYPHAENEAIFRRVRDTGEAVSYKDKPFEFPDQPGRGVTYWDWSLVPVKDASAKVRGLVFSLRETTKRKLAELELDAERMRWRGVVEGIADEVWICDATGKMSLINLPDVTAMGLDEFEGKTVEAVLEEVDILYLDGRPRPPEEAPLLRSLRTGEVVRGEEMMRHRASGRLRYRHFSCAPLRDARGTITGAVAIVRDITENKRTEEALREADRRKDEFLGMLSHELRNPLAPIRNSIYILHHADRGSEQAARAQSVIERQTDHLTRLVDDLLDVTRIARGKIELRRTRVNLREVVSRAADDFRLLLHDRGVEYRVGIPEVNLWADADATRITQLVGNLLNNAAKFTRRGDEVTLSLQKAGENEAEIRVKDTGTGIEPALLPKVFDAFVQGDRTLARTEGGLGLGLALVKGIAELHGGKVGVESAGMGKGAEFVVSLPLAPTAGAEAGHRPADVRPNGGRRILVVDDNADAADSLAEIAMLLGHVVDVAHDGPSAIEKARVNPPDVVLCDVGLLGMSGHEVARALRANGKTGMRLIAMSGDAQPEDVRRAIDAGFDAHISKPPDPAQIERALAE